MIIQLKIDMSSDKGLNDVSPGADRSGSGSLPALFFKEQKMMVEV